MPNHIPNISYAKGRSRLRDDNNYRDVVCKTNTNLFSEHVYYSSCHLGHYVFYNIDIYIFKYHCNIYFSYNNVAELELGHFFKPKI